MPPRREATQGWVLEPEPGMPTYPAGGEALDGWRATLELPELPEMSGTCPASRVVAAGVDLVDTARLHALWSRYRSPFERRLCTPEEIERLPAEPAARPAALARLFGAKECVIKAAAGLPRGGRFADIVVEMDGGTTTPPVPDHRAVIPAGRASLRGAVAASLPAATEVVVGDVDLGSPDCDMVGEPTDHPARLLLSWAVVLDEGVTDADT